MARFTAKIPPSTDMAKFLSRVSNDIVASSEYSTMNRLMQIVGQNLGKKMVNNFSEEIKIEFGQGPYRAITQILGNPAFSLGDEMKLNASVGLSSKRAPFFHFNKGAALALSDALMSLGATSAFFSDVQLRLDSVEIGPEHANRFTDYSWVTNDLRGFCPHKLSDDEGRASIVDHLFKIGTSFITLHEQMHFVLGHLNYLRNQCGCSEIDETGQSNLGGASIDFHRRCELDADAYAMSVLLLPRSNKAIIDSYPFPCRHKWDWDILALLGVTIVFALLRLAEVRRGADMSKTKHPSAAVRLLHLFLFYDSFVCGQEQNANESNRLGSRMDMNISQVFYFILRESAVISQLFNVPGLTFHDFVGQFFADAPQSSVGKELDACFHIGDFYREAIMKHQDRDIVQAYFPFWQQLHCPSAVKRDVERRERHFRFPEEFIRSSSPQ